MRRLAGVFCALVLLLVHSERALAADPDLVILTPKDGSILHPDPKRGPVLVVKYEVKNFTVGGFTGVPTVSEGEGHVHIWLDEDPPSFTHTASDVWVYNRVAPGEHTLTLELVRRNHTPLKHSVKRTVRFTMVAE